MGRHINIPIFIPHLGCPNQCVFCNQRTISGTSSFDPYCVEKIIEENLSSVNDGDECEIAFFGGSFTGIDRDLMLSLLKTAKAYIDAGRVSSIRCSTRPDYIDEEILSLLSSGGVKTIELGLQSASDRVLAACKRGHSFADEKKACELIVKNGFTLGGQMMIGLPGATVEDEIETAKFIVESGASEARIYPTVVFKDTELYTMAIGGEYESPTLDDAIARAAEAYKILAEGGVKVLRIGLCDSENLHNENTYYSGPNHPAVGELVLGEVYYNSAVEKIGKLNLCKGASVIIQVPLGATSKIIGQNKRNKERLMKKFGLTHIKVKENSALCDLDLVVYADERK